VTCVEVIIENFGPEVVKCCLRSKIEGIILRTEGKKFSMLIDTPVTICFVIPQNENKTFKQKLFKHKTFDKFRVRTIPKNLANTQYYWVIPIPIPNTNTDTIIISFPPRAAALSGLDAGSKVRYCAHCVNLMNVR